MKEGVLPDQSARGHLIRRAWRAEAHGPQPPRRAWLQHRLREAANVRVVELPPVGLGQPPADVAPRGASARPLVGLRRLGRGPPSWVGIRGRRYRRDRPRRLSYTRIRRGCLDDLQPGVASVIARSAQPPAHHSPRPRRPRLEIIKSDAGRAVPLGRHRHRELARDQLRHVGRYALRQAGPRHMALVNAHRSRVLLGSAARRRAALHGVEVAPTAWLSHGSTERVEAHPAPPRAQAASLS